MPFDAERKRYEVQSLINHTDTIEENYKGTSPPTIGDFEDVTSRLTFEIEKVAGKLDAIEEDHPSRPELEERRDMLEAKRERVNWAGSRLLNHFNADELLDDVRRVLKAEQRRLKRYAQASEKQPA